MSVTEPLRLCVDFDRTAVPVSGRVAARRGRMHPFTGWTELFAALQVALADETSPERWPRDGERRPDPND